MDRYLIISEHTAEDCRLAVKHFIQYHANFLTHFEWGCYDNDHHGLSQMAFGNDFIAVIVREYTHIDYWSKYILLMLFAHQFHSSFAPGIFF